MEQALKDLLKQYVKHEKLINEGLECKNSSQKWQAFITKNIRQTQKSAFRQRLIAMKILQSGAKIQKNSLVADTYLNISEKRINIGKINLDKIKTYKWGDQLMTQISSETKKSIQATLSKAKDINQFFRLEIDRIFDVLSCRCELKEYFDQIKLTNKSLGNQGPLFNLFESLNFRDFVIILTKYSQQKRIIGSLLNAQGIPIPILIQAQKSLEIYPQLALDIFSFQNFSLVLNIGTSKARKSGKSFFVSKLVSIKQSYLTECSFTSSLNITTKINFSNQGRVMLADFNGQISRNTPATSLNFIQNLSKYANLLIIHLKQEEALQEKILNTKEYQILINNAQKVLIYVRDVETIQIVQMDVQQIIPQKIRKKVMVRCLPNFCKKQLDTEHKAELEYICKKEFNKSLAKKFSFMSICDNNKKNGIQGTLNYVQRLMKQQMGDKLFLKQKVLPFISNIQQQSELDVKIKNEYKDEMKSIKYSDEKNKTLTNRKSLALSNFVKGVVKLLAEQGISLQILQNYLAQWKKDRQQPLRIQFLKLTQSFSAVSTKNVAQQKKISEQIKNNILKRSQFEISIDKIISQLVFYNLIKNQTEITKIIKNYYDNQMNSLYPINIVDGNTLEFGNQALQKYFNQIKNRYTNKKIYVISIIGAQSSAKSTLLNYLFRCRFQTSAGRCTKGVYMNVCQIQEKVVIVLDTEGLLSVSARDQAFDHQIATFVLKISNLVIINNKGELTSNLTQMLEVCLYVLQCLHSKQDKNSFSPKKILFSIRDQIKPKGNFQEQMAGQIKNTLQAIKMESNLDYRNFISLQPSDILSFPNAFKQQKGLVTQVGSIDLCEETFGNCIKGMRRRIIDCLQGMPPMNSIDNFYQQAKDIWHTIQTCGKEIMYYKTIYEIRARQKIQNLFKANYEEYFNIMIKEYQSYLKKLEQTQDINTLIKSQAQLNSFQQKHAEEITKIFTIQCKTKLNITNEQWLKPFDRTIRSMCRRCANDFKDKFNRLKKRADLKKNTDQFKTKIQEQMKYYANLQNSNKGQEVIQNFNKFVDGIIEDKRKLICNIQQAKLNLDLKSIFSSAFTLNQGQFKINSLQDCQKQFNTYEDKFNLMHYITIRAQKLVSDKERKQIENTMKNIVQQCKKSLVQLFKINKINNLADVQKNSLSFLQRIEQFIKKCRDEFQKLSRNWTFAKILLSDTKMKQVLLGFLFEHIKSIAKSLKSTENQKLIEGFIKTGKQQKQRLSSLIKAGGDIKEILEIDLRKYNQQMCYEAIKKCRDNVQNSFDIIKIKLNPSSIFQKAMTKSLHNTTIKNLKEHYIQCFKIVKNINAYLFEIMCEEQSIKNRSDKINSAILETIQLYKSKLQSNINDFKIWLNAKQTQKIKSLLQKMDMVGMANHLTKTKLDQNLINFVFNRFQAHSLSVQQNIQNYLQGNVAYLQTYINSFISTTLRNQVIGCQACCPLCGMKCIKEYGHPGGHKIGKNNHVLQAFGGVRNSGNNTPTLNVCFTRESMIRSWKSAITDKTHENIKLLIDEDYKQWGEEFPKPGPDYLYQTQSSIPQYLDIWARIEEAILTHKFTYMARSNDPIITQRGGPFVLTKEDMQKELELPITKTKIKLRQYGIAV